MVVTAKTFPSLYAAFRAVEVDNGAHLIGTVYPGDPIDLETFHVPAAWEHLLPAVESALARLRAASKSDFETFVCGEQSDQEAIEARQGDLACAHKVLNDWFNNWPPKDAPAAFEDCSNCKGLGLVRGPGPGGGGQVYECPKCAGCGVEPPTDQFSGERVIYYLESISRQLKEIAGAVEGPSIGSEVLADNRDWLDCYIVVLRRRAQKAAA